MLTSTIQVFCVGAAGGIVLELTHWYALRRDPILPTYAKSPFYWTITLAMILIGGILTVLYFGDRAEPIVTFHVGLSAPLILQKLTTTVASVPGKGAGPSIISFFSW